MYTRQQVLPNCLSAECKDKGWISLGEFRKSMSKAARRVEIEGQIAGQKAKVSRKKKKTPTKRKKIAKRSQSRKRQKVVDSDSEMDEDSEETESSSDSDYSPEADEKMSEA